MLRCSIWVLLLCWCFSACSETRLNVPIKRSDKDISHDYHINLLRNALATLEGEHFTIDYQIPMTESRAQRALSNDTFIDVFWMGTDAVKESELRAIPIPTTKGLIGFRKFLIRRENTTDFDNITSLSDLQTKLACQGHDWTDTQILRNAGLTVVTSPHYEALFGMLQAGRCDYFPRALHDFARELSERSELYPSLIEYHELMIQYPFAVYFFTHKHNQALADKIEQGLKNLHDSGEFDRYMRTHPLTQNVFPLSQYKNNHIIRIDNPEWNQHNTRQHPQYWFSPEDILPTEQAASSPKQ